MFKKLRVKILFKSILERSFRGMPANRVGKSKVNCVCCRWQKNRILHCQIRFNDLMPIVTDIKLLMCINEFFQIVVFSSNNAYNIIDSRVSKKEIPRIGKSSTNIWNQYLFRTAYWNCWICFLRISWLHNVLFSTFSKRIKKFFLFVWWLLARIQRHKMIINNDHKIMKIITINDKIKNDMNCSLLKIVIITPNIRVQKLRTQKVNV